MKVFSIIREMNNISYFLSDAEYVGGDKNRLAMKMIWVSNPEICKALFNNKDLVQRAFDALRSDYGNSFDNTIRIKIINVNNPKEKIKGI